MNNGPSMAPKQWPPLEFTVADPNYALPSNRGGYVWRVPTANEFRKIAFQILEQKKAKPKPQGLLSKLVDILVFGGTT